MADHRINPILILLAVFLACCTVCFFYGRGKGYKAGYQKGLGVAKRDTLVIVDTHFVDKPVEIWKEREKVVYIPIVDTQIVHTTDSVFVALEREKRGYSGEDYECQVSGVMPSLDWIRTFPKTTVITETKIDKPRWTFGVSAGPGLLYDGKIHAGVGIVAGVQFRF